MVAPFDLDPQLQNSAEACFQYLKQTTYTVKLSPFRARVVVVVVQAEVVFAEFLFVGVK